MTIIRWLVLVLAALGLVAALAWQVWLKDEVAFGQMATAYGAKMVCSCRFVAEREMDSCQSDFTVDVSPFRFEESDNAVTVSVLGGLISARAEHTPGLGCAVTG